MTFFFRFGKLWLKIAVATAVISWIGIEVVIRLTLLDSIADTRRAIQRDLRDIAALAASGIPGDDHRRALSGTPGDSVYFNRLREYLRTLRSRTNLKEHWYTLIPVGNDSTRFGIMTHPVPFSGDLYVFQDTTVHRLFYDVLTQKRTVGTDIYRSANGIWLSGLAPVLDSAGTAVAVLEVDLRYEEYLASEEAIRTRAMWIRGIGFVVGGLLGMLMGYLISRPLRTVSEAVEQMAGNNFRGSVKLPFLLRYLPDETTRLIVNFNRMAARLDTTLGDLRAANERLQTLDHAKTVFLQFIAHELRTPLNGLQPLRLLPDVTDDPDARDILHGAVASTERLRSFSLAAERYIQALTHTPDFSDTVDLVEALPFIIDDRRLASPRYEIALDITCGSTPVHLAVPYDILEQMVRPLLDNAVKFSPEGCRINVTVTLDGTQVCLAVCDPGYGFPPDVAGRLFEPFFVADIEHHSQGTGVSLSIARVLAELYHGELTATSDGPGCGSTFTLLLPTARLTAEERSTVPGTVFSSGHPTSGHPTDGRPV